MDVVMYDPYREMARSFQYSTGVLLEDLFAQCDAVSLHLPLSFATEKLINAKVLSHSKR